MEIVTAFIVGGKVYTKQLDAEAAERELELTELCSGTKEHALIERIAKDEEMQWSLYNMLEKWLEMGEMK